MRTEGNECMGGNVLHVGENAVNSIKSQDVT